MADWSRRFDVPIPVPTGELSTLREAGEYVAGLPKREHDLPHWQIAVQTLIDAAEHGGIVMMADIAMRRALAHGQPKPSAAARKKPATRYRIVK
jgi:hypothetical protein